MIRNLGNIFKVIFLTFIFSIICLYIKAQIPKKDTKEYFNNSWMIDANIGRTNYYGNLSDKSFFEKLKDETKFAYGITLSKQITPVIGLRVQLLNGKLTSSKDSCVEENLMNLYFNSDIFEYNISSTFDLSNLIWGYNYDRKLNFYTAVGLGMANWKTKLMEQGTNKVIATNGFGGRGPNKRTTEFVLPICLGLNYNIIDNLSINLETSMRILNSDILDAKEGGRLNNDMYSYNSIGITYKFGVRNNVHIYKREKNKNKEKNKGKSKKPRNRRKKRNQEEIEPPKLMEYPAVDEVFPVKKVEKAKNVNKPGEENINQKNNIVPEQEAVYNEGKFIITGNKNTANLYKGNANHKVGTSNTNIVSEANVSQSVYKGIEYRVQILASRNKIDVQKLAYDYKIDEPIKEDYSNGWYRYLAGSFNTYNQAVDYSYILADKGFKDAFVVVYNNGVKIPLTESLKK